MYIKSHLLVNCIKDKSKIVMAKEFFQEPLLRIQYFITVHSRVTGDALLHGGDTGLAG